MTESRPRSVAVSRTSIVPLSASGHDAAGLAVGAARDLAELAVEEDPVVELAAPAMEVGVADEPADLREGRSEGRAVDRDPAAPGAGALDDLDAVVLGGRPVAGRQRRRRGPGGRPSSSATRRPGRPRSSRARVPSSRPGRRSAPTPYWPSCRSDAT